MKDKIKIVAGDPEGRDLINNPSCLRSFKGKLYFIDGDKVKYYVLSNGSRGTIYEGQGISFISIDEKENLLILEKYA